ncbi:MAG: cupin domain-containing protein, partial [Fusicatenibacter saccharivorans]|nr:cupin domain-containing protein [Fusicatenibacter saccharivorans]
MQIRMDKENRELKAHGSYEFPVNISYEQLSRYERGSFSWHWHPEIELTFVLSGQIGYQVNGKSYVLKEGDGIFCNTNALHSGHMIDGMDCVY